MKRIFLSLSLFFIGFPAYSGDLVAARKLFAEGLELEKAKNYQEAITKFSAAREADHADNESLYHIGNCAYYLGRKKEAIHYYDEYIAATPKANPALRGFVGKLKQELATSAEAAAKEEALTKLAWMSNDEAKAESKKSGKPILYDFKADWCGPCKRMNKTVFQVPKNAAWINQEFLAVEVIDRKVERGSNTFEVDSLMRRNDIRVYPTLVVYQPKGGASSRMIGFYGEERTLEFLRGALEKTKLAAVP